MASRSLLPLLVVVFLVVVLEVVPVLDVAEVSLLVEEDDVVPKICSLNEIMYQLGCQ